MQLEATKTVNIIDFYTPILSSYSFFVIEVPDPEIHPPLLHLAHPFALQNLIAVLSHVKAFRDYIGSLPAGSENAHIAQGVLLDSVDCSSFDLSNLISLLEETRTSLKELKRKDD